MPRHIRNCVRMCRGFLFCDPSSAGRGKPLPCGGTEQYTQGRASLVRLTRPCFLRGDLQRPTNGRPYGLCGARKRRIPVPAAGVIFFLAKKPSRRLMLSGGLFLFKTARCCCRCGIRCRPPARRPEAAGSFLSRQNKRFSVYLSEFICLGKIYLIVGKASPCKSKCNCPVLTNYSSKRILCIYISCYFPSISSKVCRCHFSVFAEFRC